MLPISPGPNFEITVEKKWRKCMCVFSPSSDGAIQSLIFHQDTACWELTIIFILRIRVNNNGKEAARLFFDLAEDGVQRERCYAHVHN